jgi:hypothetical protein
VVGTARTMGHIWKAACLTMVMATGPPGVFLEPIGSKLREFFETDVADRTLAGSTLVYRW